MHVTKMEEEQADLDPWGKLVSESDQEDVVPIVGHTFVIGRKKDTADLVISDNKHVSGCHCILLKSNTGKHHLKDSSTNGTLLNGKRLCKSEEVELKHNDIITIVQRKEEPQLNVAYRFEDVLRTEESDATLTYDVTSEEELKEEDTSQGGGEGKQMKKKTLKRESERGTSSDRKKQKLESPSSSTAQESISGSQKTPSLLKKDSIEETLICQICQEILHDCVSLQPCMHSYCAGCYSDWMAQSSACPACRNKVERINKNHIVNNLVDAYLRANPDKKRDPEDLQDLDARNKITHDMLYPKRRNPIYSTSESSSDPSDSDSSDTHLAICRQCPDYAGSATLINAPHPYVCTHASDHRMCHCCYQQMPYRTETNIIQKCEICSRFFCYLYWGGCPSPGCQGCLAPFKDLNFPTTCLNGILGNAYESTILKNYLDDKGLTIKDFLQACCAKMESGDYSCSDMRLSPLTNICRLCAQKFLKELAYLYRKDIPDSDLPDEVVGRVDCYWGKECRTQFNKPNHAKKFNHICEKTRHS